MASSCGLRAHPVAYSAVSLPQWQYLLQPPAASAPPSLVAALCASFPVFKEARPFPPSLCSVTTVSKVLLLFVWLGPPCPSSSSPNASVREAFSNYCYHPLERVLCSTSWPHPVFGDVYAVCFLPPEFTPWMYLKQIGLVRGSSAELIQRNFQTFL